MYIVFIIHFLFALEGNNNKNLENIYKLLIEKILRFKEGTDLLYLILFLFQFQRT